MDAILASLPTSLRRLVEDQLSNNEVSSDEELLDHFIATVSPRNRRGRR